MGDGPKRVLRGLKWVVREPERMDRKPDNWPNGKEGLKKTNPRIENFDAGILCGGGRT